MLKHLPLIAITASGFAANCAPEAPTTCYTQDDCERCYCLGPETIIANSPVRPVTCDGDVSITVAGLYWKANQDGMEYAVDDAVSSTPTEDPAVFGEPNNLIDASYLTPNFKWNFGFKLGFCYTSPCDGWDVGLLWTHFDGNASSHVEAEKDDNHILLALWSAFQGPIASAGPYPGPQARDITSSWKLNLNLVDLELGREFWVSNKLSLRPSVALRYSSINEKYHLEHKGGEFDIFFPPSDIFVFNDEVDLRNSFEGVGLLTSLHTNWHLGCGWSLYGNWGASIVYGRFNIDHDEIIRESLSPFTKTRILETEDHFRASRAMLDLALGVQYSALVCDCKYGLTASLGWEQHLFFHQNQLWRVKRVGANESTFPNNFGENDHEQRRGTLSTQGLTLTFRFDF